MRNVDLSGTQEGRRDRVVKASAVVFLVVFAVLLWVIYAPAAWMSSARLARSARR
jgi:hypothetical protein